MSVDHSNPVRLQTWSMRSTIQEAVVDIGVEPESAFDFQVRNPCSCWRSIRSAWISGRASSWYSRSTAEREPSSRVDRRGERVVGSAGWTAFPAAYRPGCSFTYARMARCDDEGVAARSALDGIAQGVAEFGRGQNGDPVDEVGQVVDVVVKRGVLTPRRSASSPMLSCANPISVGQHGTGLVTEAGASRPSMRQHLGQEWQVSASSSSGVWACG